MPPTPAQMSRAAAPEAEGIQQLGPASGKTPEGGNGEETARPGTQPTGAADAAMALSVSFGDSAASGDGTPPLIEEGVEFDPDGGAALFPPTAKLAYADSGGVDPAGSTIAFWVRKEQGFDESIGKGLIELVTGTWENRLQIGMGPTFLRSLLATSDGVESGVGAGIKWAEGEWHHVAVTWGDALMTLYVDGAPQDARTYEGSFSIPPETPLYVGSSPRAVEPDTGTVAMKGLVVLQRSLASDEVAAVLTQTAPQG